MRSLLWKDVVVGRWFWVAAVPLYIAQLVAVSDVPPAFALLTLLGTSFFGFASIGVEETQGTDVLWNSLPVSRGQIVYARYAASTLGVAFGLGVSWVIAATVPGWLVADASDSAMRLGPSAYASLACVLLTLAALFLPCYFRFGGGRGLQVFSAAAVGLLLVLSIGGSALVLATGGAESLADLRQPTAEQLAAVEQWLDVWGRTLSATLAAVAVVGTAWSATISAQFYRVRDL